MTSLLPAVAKERGDGSVLMSFGDPAKGPHEQFDFHGSIDLARAIAAAYTDCHAPEGEISCLRGAMAADDERLRMAAARVGIHAGCDAPEMMADEIERLRSDTGYVTGFNDGYEHAKKTSLMIMEENSAFAIGDLVRKKSGSWWEGRVVGFYSTEQTPDGVCVQLDKPMGPVQIYPSSALELVDQGGAPEHGSEVLQQFADPAGTPPPSSHLRVTNPSTIAQFVGHMTDHGVKLPLQVTNEDIGTLLDADGKPVLVVDVDRQRTDEDVAWIRGMIQVAVNTCGGFKAQRQEADYD